MMWRTIRPRADVCRRLPGPEEDHVKNWLELSWKALASRGAIGIVFGVVALAWPGATVIAFAVLWGVWALLDGIASFSLAFSSATPVWNRLLAGVVGLVAVGAALFAFFRPGVAASTLIWILGLWLILRAVLEIAAVFVTPGGRPKALLGVCAALDLTLGAFFVLAPGSSVLAIAFVTGLIALAWGVALLATALVLRSQLKELVVTPEADFPASPVS